MSRKLSGFNMAQYINEFKLKVVKTCLSEITSQKLLDQQIIPYQERNMLKFKQKKCVFEQRTNGKLFSLVTREFKWWIEFESTLIFKKNSTNHLSLVSNVRI